MKESGLIEDLLFTFSYRPAPLLFSGGKGIGAVACT